MRVGKFVGAMTAAAVAIMPVAASAQQAVGSLVAVNGDAFVARDGRLIRAQPAMAVRAGDRVITRAGGTANVALNGCSVNVSGGEMKTFGGNACGSVQSASFVRAGADTSGGSHLLGQSNAGGYVIVVVALAAVIAGIVIATEGKPSSTSP